MITRRPVSLSDSNIYTGNYTSINDFHVRLTDGAPAAAVAATAEATDSTLSLNSVASAEVATKPDSTVTTNLAWSYVEFIVDYSMRFTFHLLLISIFEVLFYFQFVSKDEDAGILITTNYYTDSIINSCTSLNSTEAAILNFILGKFINSSQVNLAGATASSGRQLKNAYIYRLSLIYIGILAGLQGGLVLISVINKFKIKWGHIILENLALVVFLGLYELMFFETIIKQYDAITPGEISAQFVTGLQQRCGLLKN
jgi:hypothetical protein